MDYDFTPKWRLTGRYTHDLSETRELGGLFLRHRDSRTWRPPTPTCPARSSRCGLKTILSNNALNEFTYQRSSNAITTTNPDGTKGMRSDYGINIPEIFPENLTNRIPTVAISGLSSWPRTSCTDIQYVNHTFTDNFSWQRGSHAFKVGGLVTFEQKNENATSATQGSFTFSRPRAPADARSRAS